ncbi:protein of unknown function [Agreia sp. COWG]|nr:protein of unknown function [Agreia sp. COWG]
MRAVGAHLELLSVGAPFLEGLFFVLPGLTTV